MRIRIECLEGGRAGEQFTFRKSPITIGRDPSSDLPLDSTADDEASWRHAEIRVEGNEVRVVDLGSTNGTYRDEEPVKEAVLKSGDRVRFGPTGPLVEVRFGSVLGRLWASVLGGPRSRRGPSSRSRKPPP